MKFIRILLFAIFGLALTAALLFAAVWVFNIGSPKVVMTDPAPEGRRIDEGNLLANYYAPETDGVYPGVLLIGGSEGGLGKGMARVAAALKERGYAVLHVSYFAAPGQNRRLEMIPLETFDSALAFLAERPEVDPARLAVIGGSKGAEAALIVASRHPEIRAVVAGMPSSVAWQGIEWNIARMIASPPGSSWSANGAPVPYLPYGRPENPGRDIAEVYRAGLRALPEHPDAVIAVERARAETLLICGEADTLWPSCDMARAVKTRADAAQGPSVRILSFREAGHGVFGLPLEDDDPTLEKLAARGGTPIGNNTARKEGWTEALAHLENALK